MSQKEFNRLEIFEQVASKRITQVQAASQLQLGMRQVIRLYKNYKQINIHKIFINTNITNLS